jgi:polyisoprenoid-binding protein YceI
MKRVAFNSILIAFIGLGVISCKNDKNNETEAKEAQEAKEMSEGDSAMTFKLMKEDSKILWAGSKAVGVDHNGTIQLKDAKFQLENGKINGGKAVIDMTSIKSIDLEGKPEKKKKLESHLMGTAEGKETDFYNVEKYPEATFEVTDFTEKENQKMLSGNLTIKDKTKNISFPVEVSMGNDQKAMKLISKPFTIDRTKWGVKFGSGSVFDDLTKDQVINDDIELTLQLKLERS